MSEIVVTVDTSNMVDDLVRLVHKCFSEKPDKKDLDELRKYLRDNPKLYRAIFDLTESLQSRLIKRIIELPAARVGIEANIVEMRRQIDYENSPMLERMLIENIVNAWLNYQYTEWGAANVIDGAHSMSEGEYWTKLIGAANRRYLAAIETLARVRKITRATLQVNIAQPGSQQVNIAGDYVKPD